MHPALFSTEQKCTPYSGKEAWYLLQSMFICMLLNVSGLSAGKLTYIKNKMPAVQPTYPLFLYQHC